jgi:hypothetical protein
MHNLTLTMNVHTILGFAVYTVLATIILFVTQFVCALADGFIASLRGPRGDGSSEVTFGLIERMIERWRESIVAAVIVAIVGLLDMPVLHLFFITIVCGILLSFVPKSGPCPD